MIVLNLGCGTKTSDHQNVINIDWSIYLRIKKNPVFRHLAPLIIKGERQKKLRSLPNNIMVHNLTKKLPFESNTVDAVYHSHVLEHIPRKKADRFLVEVNRVLKPGGIHRVVVPDFEGLCRRYLDHFQSCIANPSNLQDHESYISNIIEQLVRREPFGPRKKKPIPKFIELLILGDALRRGESHQWMYDAFSLKELLSKVGFNNIIKMSFNQSQIPEWRLYGLDHDNDGEQYKKDSSYMEAIK